MRSRRSPIILVAAVFGPLAGCSDYQHQERPPWRAQAEQACLAKGLVHESVSVRPFHELDGPGICGATHPFKVTALADGAVAFNATQTLDCPMIAALDTWVRDVVQPAAEARFGEKVVRINSMGSYSCRGINNMSGASLSEHSFANAVDIGGFVLASGRELNITKGFNGQDEQERAFLHEAHAGACTSFTTVLGPGYNIFHYNHFHLDLALHGSTSRGPRRYCKPVPQSNLPGPPVKDNLPDPPPIEEEMDIARAPLPEPAYRSGPPTLVASVPPAPSGVRSPAYTPRPTAMVRSAEPDLRTPEPRPPAVRPPGADPAEPPLITFGMPDTPQPRPPRALALVPAGGDAMPFASSTSPRLPRRNPSAPALFDAPAGGADNPQNFDITSSVRR